MEKDEHVGGPFARLFVESKSLSRDALKILLASEHGKGTIPASKGLSTFAVKGTLIPFKQSLRPK